MYHGSVAATRNCDYRLCKGLKVIKIRTWGILSVNNEKLSRGEFPRPGKLKDLQSSKLKLGQKRVHSVILFLVRVKRNFE